MPLRSIFPFIYEFYVVRTLVPCVMVALSGYTVTMTMYFSQEMTLWEAMLAILYVLWTLTNISYVYEHK